MRWPRNDPRWATECMDTAPSARGLRSMVTRPATASLGGETVGRDHDLMFMAHAIPVDAL